MGAWGPALFSDDLACDVRDGYRALGFEPLMGLVRSRPQDEVLDPEAYTHWEGLAETMQRFAGCR
ncbi:hypothetical protein [Planomonospora algeriensis]